MDSSTSEKPSRRLTLASWADSNPPSASFLQKKMRGAVRLILITIKEFGANNLSLRSAALTYTVLLSLVPVLAMSTAVVKGLGGGDQLKKAAYAYIDTLETSSSSLKVPGFNPSPEKTGTQEKGTKTLTAHLRSAADTLFDYVERTSFTTLGTIGMIGILLSVILVLNHIESAMNCIWKVDNGRPLLRKIADYLALLILMPVSINVAFAASAFLKNPALAAKMDLVIPFIWLQTLLLKLLPVFFIAFTLYIIYIFFPNTRVKTLPAVFGAILAALLWFTVQNIYITLQVGVAKYNAIYGSFATLPLFLVWMYLGWIFILTGAQVAYGIQNLGTYTLLRKEEAPSLQLAAAFDITECIYTSFSNDTAILPGDLYQQLPHYSRTVLSQVLARLQDTGIVHCSSTTKQLLPAAPMDQLRSRKIIKAIFGTETPDTPGGQKSRQIIALAAKAVEEKRTESDHH